MLLKILLLDYGEQLIMVHETLATYHGEQSMVVIVQDNIFIFWLKLLLVAAWIPPCYYELLQLVSAGNIAFILGEKFLCVAVRNIEIIIPIMANNCIFLVHKIIGAYYREPLLFVPARNIAFMLWRTVTIYMLLQTIALCCSMKYGLHVMTNIFCLLPFEILPYCFGGQLLLSVP